MSVSMSVESGEIYFEVDGDDELRPAVSIESARSPNSITWRGDPEETGSDCSITVVTNELQANTYYVHKRMICFGSKQSKFFVTLLLENSAVTSSKNETGNSNTKRNTAIKVELDQRDAENFPIFLDFIYKPAADRRYKTVNKPCDNTSPSKIEASIVTNRTMETVQSSFSSPSMISIIPSSSGDTDDVGSSLDWAEDVTTDNAVSLRYLARRFENEALTFVVNKFIQKDLNFSTGPIYLCKASEYKDDRLIESAQRLCVENIAQIDTKALLRLPLNLFRVVIRSLESFENENQELSLMLSDVVCRYLEQNPKSSSADLLLDLTDPLLMPYISPDAAIGYTAIVKDLEPEDAAIHWDSLVRLCRRCAKAVVKEYGWSDFSVCAAVNEYLESHNNKSNAVAVQESTENRKFKSAARVDSLLFATSFAAALEQAQDDFDDVLNAYDRFTKLTKAFQESLTVMENEHQQKDELIVKQQNELRNARHEIRELKRQVNDQTIETTAPPQKKPELRPSNSQRSQDSNVVRNEIRFPPGKVQHRNGNGTLDINSCNTSTRDDVSSPTKRTSDHQIPSRQPDRQNSSPTKSCRDQQQRPPQLGNNVSSPVPMARQRMQQNQHLMSTYQVSNHNSHREQPARQLLQHQNSGLRSRKSDRGNLAMKRETSRHHHHQVQQHTSPQPYDEPIVRLCMGSHGGQQPSHPMPQPQEPHLQHQQRQVLRQQQAVQQPPRKKHHHLPLTNAKDEPYKYHPDLLEMSFSEVPTTMEDDADEANDVDDEYDDDDYDSIFEIEMSFSTVGGQDLISPSQVGVDVHSNKNEKRRELKTKNEMRSKSLLV